MPVTFYGHKSQHILVTVRHSCGHVYRIKCHPDTSDEQRAEIAAQQATQICAACSTGQATAARNRGRGAR